MPAGATRRRKAPICLPFWTHGTSCAILAVLLTFFAELCQQAGGLAPVAGPAASLSIRGKAAVRSVPSLLAATQWAAEIPFGSCAVCVRVETFQFAKG
jgi:hypothetical protein